MIEVLWHGRGGQGAFTAARLLGAAASMDKGTYALAFPSFGPERRGAPMRAFTKFSHQPIGDRSAITRANIVVYLDETLLQPGWENELKPGGVVLVNSRKQFSDCRLKAIDANGISAAILGRPIPNTVFLGAITHLCPAITEAAVKEAIAQYMPQKLHEKNWAIVDKAVRAVEGLSEASAVDTASCLATAETEAAPVNATEHPRSSEALSAPAAPGVRCRLRDETAPDAPSLDPASFAKNTCYIAGHLVTKNAGWRNQRPVLDNEKCTMCLQCYLYCPDGTIYKVRNNHNDTVSLAIDYNFCKGCGVCVRTCCFGALTLVDETESKEGR